MSKTDSTAQENKILAERLLKKARSQIRELNLQNRKLKRELNLARKQGLNNSPAGEIVVAEIEQRGAAELRLQPGKSLLRRIIDAAGDLIYVKDRDGVYRACNKESERFLGITEAEQIGKTDFDFFEYELAKQIQTMDQQILSSGVEICTEEWVPAPNGEMVLLETRKSPFYDAGGEVAGLVGISRNVTQRKEAENALKKANQDLDAFVRTVAHDLRTPLTPMIGYAEILRRKCLIRQDEEAIQFLDEIISSGEEIQLLIKDLLTVAVTGKIERPLSAVDTQQIVKDLIHKLEQPLTQAVVSVDLETLPELRVPKSIVLQLFENLILNAIKYGSKPGDVIEVGGYRECERVKLYVRDHGVGVPAEERRRIFEVFSRGTTAGESAGHGIGLATVKKIAEKLDGHAWVEETRGGGSTFWIDIHDPSIDDSRP